MQETEAEQHRQEEFLSLYQPVHERFARYCMAIAGNEQSAKDLVNESLLRAFEGFEKIRKKESFIFFLFGTAKRVWSNERRKDKFWEDRDLSSLRNYYETVQTDYEADVFYLYAALNKLSKEQKEALILFEILGFSISEIQEIQQASASAVKARLARGRRNLSELLSDIETKNRN